MHQAGNGSCLKQSWALLIEAAFSGEILNNLQLGLNFAPREGDLGVRLSVMVSHLCTPFDKKWPLGGCSEALVTRGRLSICTLLCVTG